MYSRYPILSSIIILPLGVVRLMKLRNPNSISDSGEFVGVAFIAVSGILNAALYLMTRRRLLWGIVELFAGNLNMMRCFTLKQMGLIQLLMPR
jgi:hypothetical protein